MNKNIIFIIAGVILVSSGIFFVTVNNEDNTTVDTGASSPALTENDGENAISDNPIFNLKFTDVEGAEVTLADFSGKPLVVNSWATWCPFCVNELPDFAEAQKEFGDKIIIIAINRRESKSQTQEYVDGLHGASGLVYLLDSSDSFYKSIGGFGMPETLFINASGETVVHKRGPMDLSEIQDKIKQIL